MVNRPCRRCQSWLRWVSLLAAILAFLKLVMLAFPHHTIGRQISLPPNTLYLGAVRTTSCFSLRWTLNATIPPLTCKKQHKFCQGSESTPLDELPLWLAHCKLDQIISGSAEAQKRIFKHQNPQTCDGKKYLVMWDMATAGIGGLAHFHVLQLGLAFYLNRIAVFVPSDYSLYTDKSRYDNGFLDKEFCGSASYADCYFLPLSNCTPSEADLQSGVRIPGRVALKNMYSSVEEFSGSSNVLFSNVEIASDWGRQFDLEYWQSQFLPYLFRLNTRTRELIENMRHTAANDLVIPPKTLAVHVRKGDKEREISVADDASFVSTIHLVQIAFEFDYLFISTEDRTFIENSSKTIRGFKQVFFTNYLRYEQNRKITPTDWAKEHGILSDFTHSLLNLELYITCDGYMGQIGSFWVLMMYHLRRSSGCAVQKPYFEVRKGFANEPGVKEISDTALELWAKNLTLPHELKQCAEWLLNRKNPLFRRQLHSWLQNNVSNVPIDVNFCRQVALHARQG